MRARLRGLLLRLSGGRPMERLEFRFIDAISGKPVYLYRDGRGREWLATGSWAWFRVLPIARQRAERRR